MKSKKEEDYSENLSTKIRLLGMILNKTDGFVRHLDAQTNILLGINSAVFVFSASQIKNNGDWSIFFIVVYLFSSAASLISLMAIHPPKFMRKRNQKESLMYNKKVAHMKSSHDYAKKIEAMLKSEDEMREQFAIEIYNLCKFYYRPKRKLFNLSRNVLLSGILAGILAFVANFVYMNSK